MIALSALRYQFHPRGGHLIWSATTIQAHVLCIYFAPLIRVHDLKFMNLCMKYEFMKNKLVMHEMNC